MSRKARTHGVVRPKKQANHREIEEALRAGAAAARKVRGCEDPESIASEATAAALETWDGRAKLSTLTTTIAFRMAVVDVQRRSRARVGAAGFYDLTGTRASLTGTRVSGDDDGTAAPGERAEPRRPGRPASARLHTREAVRADLEARWRKATDGRPLPRKPPESGALERQRRAVNALADAWDELLAAYRGPDGTMAPHDGVMRHTIGQAALRMYPFTQWRDESRVTRRSLLDVHLGPDASDTARALAVLLWWELDELSDSELQEGVAPGELVAEAIRLLPRAKR